MRPSDLKPPFIWKERKITISDRVWYIPPRTPERYFEFPGWEHETLFGNCNPIKVEYCSGNGDWIAAKALENPECNWVAVEKQFDRVRKIWSKSKNLKLNNLVIICGEALDAAGNFFPNQSISEIYINFPDPWPKTRHAKNRIIQQNFLEAIWKNLKPESLFSLVTDDQQFSIWSIKQIFNHSKFKPVFPAPGYCIDFPEYGTSYFEKLWRRKGKKILFHQFSKIDADCSTQTSE